jgi:hypothetical protein
MPSREVIADATEEVIPKLVTDAATSRTGTSIITGAEE